MYIAVYSLVQTVLRHAKPYLIIISHYTEGQSSSLKLKVSYSCNCSAFIWCTKPSYVI